MKRLPPVLLFIIALILILAGSVEAQTSSSTAYRFRKGSSLPATCAIGDVFYKTAATQGAYLCDPSSNTWVQFVTGTASTSITIGVTTITGGANTKVLFNNAGVVGEYTTT